MCSWRGESTFYHRQLATDSTPRGHHYRIIGYSFSCRFSHHFADDLDVFRDDKEGHDDDARGGFERVERDAHISAGNCLFVREYLSQCL
uniref:Uncharacterized protein n=1 Tax=Steinernema glaseri TaxID=37863 RepID=A0A1I7ZTT4_9BILA